MTELTYITRPAETEIETHVVGLVENDDGLALVLERTPFYPQAGGQPTDVGVVQAPGFTYAVRKATLVDGLVHHSGHAIAGEPVAGRALARIDPLIRALHARLHSGGHLVATAMFELTGMRAIKGYHFPDGPYIECGGVLSSDARADIAAKLDRRLAEMVEENAEVSVESTTVSALVSEGVFIPKQIPLDKPTRVVTTFGYRSPCGGTHVERTSELVGLYVRSVRSKAGRTRISYGLERR